jgi:DNA polymerase-4
MAGPHVVLGARVRAEELGHDRPSCKDDIDAHVARLATEVTESVVAEGRRVTHVALKVRSAAFFTRTKISKLPEPTTGSGEVVRVARIVLDRFQLDRPVRLLGVRVVPAPLD